MCNKEIGAPANRKFCGSQTEIGSCSWKNKKEMIAQNNKEISKKNALKEKPIKYCEYKGCGKEMIGASNRKRFCGQDRDINSCSYKHQQDSIRSWKKENTAVKVKSKPYYASEGTKNAFTYWGG